MRRSLISLFVILTGCTVGQNKDPITNDIVEIVSPEPGTQVKSSPVEQCPAGMVYVSGEYCTEVEQTCLKWIDTLRCESFAPSKCKGKKIKKSFCIDKYEWPNKPHELPSVMITWNQMKSNCEAEGKRLCLESEWTLACEGPEMLPYPYGLNRDASKCNIDREWMKPDERKLLNPKTRWEEVYRLDKRVESGSMPCLSPYGVADMTGNIDEFTVNESGFPYKNAMKGGHYSGVRNRCRKETTAHNEEYVGYSAGGRCCK